MSNKPHLVFSCFLTEVDHVATALGETASRDNGSVYQLIRSPLDLEEVAFGKPSSSGRTKKKAVIFEAQADPVCTVLVSNIADGWHTLVNVLSARLNVPCIQINSTADGVINAFNQFEIQVPGMESRVVHALEDGDRWVFFEKGPIQPFESPEHYKKRRIRDRLRRQDLMAYLEALGIDAQSEDFWKGEGRHGIYLVQV
ncbi:hypothetical protein ACNI65_09840 [Roseateles sp. So40a]|uniref:hypothetical protein n=1 Tax=Roseateles sp. So40a TaxID=3400226 RepID=UPI003A8873B7